MTNTKRITDFQVSWTADHEQYFQGHSIPNGYDDGRVGQGDTLREALEDVLDNFAEDGITDIMRPPCETPETDLLLQVKEPEMLDWSVVEGYCQEYGEHFKPCEHDVSNPDTCEVVGCDGPQKDEDPDCAVCAGEWHYYVMVDVKTEEV